MSSTFRMPEQKPKKECYTFEPQQWRKSVCKNCFRTQPEHTTKPPSQQQQQQQPTLESPLTLTSVMPVNTTIPTTTPGGGGGGGTGHSRSSAMRSKNGSSSSGVQQLQASNPQTDSLKGTANQPQSAAQGLFSSASSIDARYVEELENDFFELEDKFDNMNREKEEINNELTTKLHQIDELQLLIQQYKEKVTALERRCSHLEEEVKSYRERLRLPESDQAVSGDVVKSSTPIDLSPSTVRGSSFAINIQTASKEELRKRITYMEQMCHEVAEENDLLKEEIEEMQREIEEMHDHFQEEGRDTMREMQRDLEATNKTCRILQFKLRKAERRFDQCESERANLEERLARLEAELYSEADVAHIRSIEEELRVAKEVGVRLNSELDMLDEKRAYYEEENRQLKEDIQIAHNRRTFLENELGRLKLEMEKLKSEAGPLQVVDKNRSRLTTEPTLSKKPSIEEQELQRELDATKEREVDLSEQLRFAEDEATKLKRRLQDASADNDELSRRLDRLMNATLSSSKPSKRSLSPKTSVSTTSSLLEKGKTLDDDPNKMREYIELLKNRLLQVESEQERLELETKNLKAIAQSVVDNNKALRMSSSGIKMDDISASGTVPASDYQMQRDRLKEWCRRLNQIDRDINLIAKIDKENNWLEKYNDAKEIIADLEGDRIKFKKQLTDLQNENSFLKSQQRKFDQSQRRERDRITTKENTAKMSNELLAHEINNLEEELDEVTSELVTAREQANSLTLQNNNLTNTLENIREETSKRERELINYINGQEIKISALVSLNGLLRQRSDDLQTKFDKLDSLSEQKGNSVDREIEDLRLKIKTLELQVKESEKISQLGDTLRIPKSLEATNLVDSSLKNKEINLLKKELEEKDEIIEENSLTIRELTTKMDNLWKMNDALKSLVDSEEETKESKANRLEVKQANIEMNNFKREIDTLKKDNYNLAQKILGLEKVRESLTKENCDLQEEIKLREDSVFEQDDELQKKTNEIRQLKNQIETLTREYELTKENLAEAKRRETAGTSGRLGAQIAENERLRAELNNTIRELKVSNQKCSDQAASMREAKEKVDAVRSEMDRASQMMREKDSFVIDLNKQIRALNGDLNGCKSELKLANEKLESKDSQLKITQEKLTANEKQLKAVNQAIEELKAEREATMAQESVKNRDILPPTTASTLSSTNTGTMGRRSEIERLKRELLSVKKDRDAIIKDAKRERIHLEQKVSALIERQREVERGSTTNLSGSILNLATGDSYTRALATQATATKIALLNEHVMRQNRYAMELKVQNESLHNSVLDYQRKYRSLKEQYEAEQEAWLTERVMLESLSRETEDRRTTLANTKRTIQQMHIQLSEQEAEWFKQKMDFEEKISKLEKENNTFKSKIVAMEEQQKLPKVLQRFGSTSAGRVNNSPITNLGNASSAMQADLQRRLEISERSMQRLRSETAEKFEVRAREHTQLVNRYEHQRIELEREIEILKEQLVDMETFRQQAELFCQRQREVEEIAEREFKLWNEEREQLMGRCEDGKICVDQWYQRLVNRAKSEVQNPDEIVVEVVTDMEKWKTAKPKQYIKRRISQGMSPGFIGGKFESFDQMNACGSVPASPAPNWNRGLLSQSQLSAAQRSTSMEWFNKLNSQSSQQMNGGPGSLLSQSVYKGSALSLIGNGYQNNNQCGGLAASANYASLQRCGRSVSPDISIKKVTNYPDPSAGFLLRSQSRQASTESLNSDYTGRAFTLPGKPSQKLPISPARRKFFENDESGTGVNANLSQPVKESPYDLMSKSMTKSTINNNNNNEINSNHGSPVVKVEVTPVITTSNGAASSVTKQEKTTTMVKSKNPFSLGKSSSSLDLKPSASSKANSFVNKLSSKFSTSKSSLAIKSTDSSAKPPSAPTAKTSSKASSVEPEQRSKTTQMIGNNSTTTTKLTSPSSLLKKAVEKTNNLPAIKPLVSEPTKIIRSSSTLTNSSLTSSTNSSTSTNNNSGADEKTLKKTTSTTPIAAGSSDSRRSSRSGSISGISPSIMHLRQKFSGGTVGAAKK